MIGAVYQALSFTDRVVPVGAAWSLRVIALDVDQVPVATAPTFTVTLPDGTAGVAPVATGDDCGVWTAVYTPATPGRYLARADLAGYGAVSFVATASEVTDTADFPTYADLGDYLGEHSYTDAELTDALAVEVAAQRRVCRILPAYQDDLRGALLRRGQRNLAMRRLPLAVLRGDADAGGSDTILPGNDPEVRRLERPWRKLPIG